MSAQSIYIRKRHTVREEAEKEILKQADNYLYKKRFMLGEGVKANKRNKALIILDFICKENCEIIQLIDKELKGCLVTK